MKHIFIGLVVVTLIIVLYLIFSQSEEEKIRDQISTLSSHISSKRPTNPLLLANKIENIKELFAPVVFIESADWRSGQRNTREEMGTVILYALKGKLQWNLIIDEIEFVSIDKKEATLKIKIHLSGKDNKGKIQFDRERHFEMKLIKEKDVWLFSLFKDIESEKQ